MVTVSVEEFEELVAGALDTIPPPLRAGMENVAVVVDDVSPVGGLLGLYEGVPLTKRGAEAMPDVNAAVAVSPVTIACVDSYRSLLALVDGWGSSSKLAGRVFVSLTSGTRTDALGRTSMYEPCPLAVRVFVVVSKLTVLS